MAGEITVRVWIDGIIFALQRHGGISRCWTSLLQRLATHEEIDLLLHWPKGCVLPSTLSALSDRCRTQQSLRTHGIAGVYRRLQMRWMRPQFFHSTYYTLPATKHTPTVVTVHDFIDEKFAAMRPCGEHFLQLKRRTIESADAIIAVSQTVMDQIETYCAPKARLRAVIHHAVDTPFKHAADADSVAMFRRRWNLQRPFWLHVGQRNHYKNFQTLLDAWLRTARQTEMDLVVIGGTPGAAAQYGETLEHAGLTDRFHGIDSIDDLELSAAYTAATAMVYPSIEEGFGIPLLEAMGCGTAVIASDIAVFHEVAGNAAEFFAQQDSDSLAVAMARVLEEPYRQELVRRGRLRTHVFSWDQSTQRLMNVYRELTKMLQT
jgi:glycosyltransferase involved in cell wall biosynthesis